LIATAWTPGRNRTVIGAAADCRATFHRQSGGVAVLEDPFDRPWTYEPVSAAGWWTRWCAGLLLGLLIGRALLVLITGF
jgi:hypothetical protein